VDESFVDFFLPDPASDEKKNTNNKLGKLDGEDNIFSQILT
jgi:hypothetical protein